MGADIYVKSIHDKREIEFNVEALRRAFFAMDQTKVSPEVLEDARKAWMNATDKANEGCYFRDSYNSSNLAWLVGLSYWESGEHIDPDTGLLHINEVKRWHDVLEAADMPKLINEAIANAKLNQADKLGPGDDRRKPELVLSEDETVDEVVQYFTTKKERFLKLLKRSLRLNEGLYWSV